YRYLLTGRVDREHRARAGNEGRWKPQLAGTEWLVAGTVAYGVAYTGTTWNDSRPILFVAAFCVFLAAFMLWGYFAFDVPRYTAAGRLAELRTLGVSSFGSYVAAAIGAYSGFRSAR